VLPSAGLVSKVDSEISIEAYLRLLNLLLLIATGKHEKRTYIKSEEKMFVFYMYLNNLESLERCVQVAFTLKIINQSTMFYNQEI